MHIETEETTTIKFFKWVILSKTVKVNNKVIINEPVFIPDKEYFEREFKN